jgi:CCR4-NOT transcriptional regulation complex NOT5 subunit
MLTAITQQKISEIERYLEEIKVAEKEGDIERLKLNVERLDNAVYKLRVRIYWKQRQLKE